MGRGTRHPAALDAHEIRRRLRPPAADGRAPGWAATGAGAHRREFESGDALLFSEDRQVALTGRTCTLSQAQINDLFMALLISEDGPGGDLSAGDERAGELRRWVLGQIGVADNEGDRGQWDASRACPSGHTFTLNGQQTLLLLELCTTASRSPWDERGCLELYYELTGRQPSPRPQG